MNKKTSAIEHLFGSSTRVKLLRIFLHHPEESFYVRELTRRAEVQIHAIRRELETLETIGLLTSRRETPGAVEEEGKKRVPVAERKYYQVNQDFILFPELRALLTKGDLLFEETILERIKALGDVRYVSLLGRFVGDTQAPTDMFVVGLLPKKPLSDLVADLESEVSHEINFTVLTPREFKYRKDVTDRFLFSIIESKKIVLIDKTGGLDRI